MLASPLAIQPASAIPIAGNGCAASSGITSAAITWYPANPASMSGIQAACGFNNNTGTSQVSASFSIHDTEVASWHNGAAKPVTNSVAAVLGATTIQLNPAANGIVGLPVTPTQMNRIISGPGIGPRTVVKSMTAGGLVTLNRPTTGAVPINSALKIENAIARTVDDATSTAPDLLNSVQGNFTAADIGLSVSGTGVPANTTIIAVVGPAQVQLSNSLTLTGPTVSIGGTLLVSTVRSVTGVTTTSATRMVSATGLGSWVASDIGLPVTGSCTQLTATTADDVVFPANTVITATPSQANADVTAALPFPASGCTVVVGVPNANAPANGEQVAQQGVQLNLNPSLVAGSDDCANDQPEGFALVGKWYNPGSFQGSGATVAQPGPTPALPATLATKAIGQIYFDTSAADFAALVIERKGLTAGDPNGSVHYDVLFPFAPTGLALCPSSATSPGLSFSLAVNATTASQSTLPTGTGRPGTGQVRSIQAQTSGGYTTTVYVRSDSATVFTPATNFQRLCIYPVGSPNPINFQCGAG